MLFFNCYFEFLLHLTSANVSTALITRKQVQSFLHVFSGGSRLWGRANDLAPLRCDTCEEVLAAWLCDVKVFKMSLISAKRPHENETETWLPKLEVSKTKTIVMVSGDPRTQQNLQNLFPEPT